MKKFTLILSALILCLLGGLAYAGVACQAAAASGMSTTHGGNGETFGTIDLSHNPDINTIDVNHSFYAGANGTYTFIDGRYRRQAPNGDIFWLELQNAPARYTLTVDKAAQAGTNETSLDAGVRASGGVAWN